MRISRFMRLIIFFDLPMKTNRDLRIYRNFVKYLKNEGYIRIQYSVYAKLCINKDSAKTASKRVIINAPEKGDIRYMIITENQYQHIANVNGSYCLQEKVSTINRTLMIGGMNGEDQ